MGRVLIAGAGIGGLTAAHALLAAGAGITVQANAIAALQRIDLAADVLTHGRVLRLTQILRSNGRILAST